LGFTSYVNKAAKLIIKLHMPPLDGGGLVIFLPDKIGAGGNWFWGLTKFPKRGGGGRFPKRGGGGRFPKRGGGGRFPKGGGGGSIPGLKVGGTGKMLAEFKVGVGGKLFADID